MSRKGRSKVVDKASVDQISSLLKELPKKEKQDVPISEAIAGLADTIKGALVKGYSYDELAQMLSDHLGVSVSVWSLRRYLSIATKTSTKPPTRRGRKAKTAAPDEASAAAASIEEPTVTVAVEPEAPAATRKQRTRTSEAKAPAKKTDAQTQAVATPEADSAAKPAVRKSRNATPKSTGTRGRRKAQ